MNISEIKAILAKETICQACKKPFLVENLKISGLFEEGLVIFDGVCENNHPAARTRFVVFINKLYPESFDFDAEPIKKEDVINFEKNIKNFKGDFAQIL